MVIYSMTSCSHEFHHTHSHVDKFKSLRMAIIFNEATPHFDFRLWWKCEREKFYTATCQKDAAQTAQIRHVLWESHRRAPSRPDTIYGHRNSEITTTPFFNGSPLHSRECSGVEFSGVSIVNGSSFPCFRLLLAICVCDKNRWFATCVSTCRCNRLVNV